VQLVSLLHPTLLHLLFMLAVVSAFGRELRDGEAGAWAPGMAAMAGKAAPYVAVFMGWSLAAILWLAGVRGWQIAGSPAMLILGYAAMYAAYLGVAVLLVGATRTMSQSLSLTGLYAGASFAFAGAVFPLERASAFAQFWANALPFTHFARLLARTWIAPGSGWALAVPMLAMLAIAAITLVPGTMLYLRAAADPASWGRR
jgi:ABC-2 type transport system permease protein